LALDVNLRALLAVLLDDAADVLVEHDDVVPLGALLALAGGLVAPGLGGREREVDDLVAGIGAADARILAQVADQNDLVDAASHDALPTRRRRDAHARRLKPDPSPSPS